MGMFSPRCQLTNYPIQPSYHPIVNKNPEKRENIINTTVPNYFHNLHHTPNETSHIIYEGKKFSTYRTAAILWKRQPFCRRRDSRARSASSVFAGNGMGKMEGDVFKAKSLLRPEWETLDSVLCRKIGKRDVRTVVLAPVFRVRV